MGKSKISQLPDERRLLRELSAKIRFSGPITVAEYMREVAINPIHGFYVSQEALGKHGHFVTSPELSQMFGECVAVWFLHEWMKMGEPQGFQLVELGPGKGTLLTDILRTLTKLQPGLVQGISLHLVEVSPRMRKEQVKELGIRDGVSKWGTYVHWHDHIADVPQNFSFFLAHEFLDALPVNKFERVISEDNAWREVLVDIDEEREGELRYVISRNATPSCVLLEGLDLEGVHKTELCPNAGLYIREVRMALKNKLREMRRRMAAVGEGLRGTHLGHLGTINKFTPWIYLEPLTLLQTLTFRTLGHRYRSTQSCLAQ